MIGPSGEREEKVDASRSAGSVYRGSLGPFLFESELDLPELGGSGEIPVAGLSGVSIRLGKVPESIAGGVAYDELCTVSPVEYMLRIPEVATYLVSRGDTIVVEPHPGAAPAEVRAYLYGSIFGALCHQNSLLPLHASAVGHKGSAVAFLGDSGAGKSTLAAALQARGYRAISDDICLLQPDVEPMEVIPVARWLKLESRSLARLGGKPDPANRVFATDSKFRVYLQQDAEERLSLGSLIFLERSDGDSQTPTLIAMPAGEAVAAAMRMTYLGYLQELTGGYPLLFRRCAALIGRTQAFRLSVPWGLDRLDDVADLVEERVLGASGRTPPSVPRV